MFYPNSPNTELTLLSINNIKDDIGNIKTVIKSFKKVIGIKKSITQSEYLTAKEMKLEYEIKVSIQAFLYDGSKFAKLDGKLYKIERTYVNGQYIELYLSSSDIEVEDA